MLNVTITGVDLQDNLGAGIQIANDINGLIENIRIVASDFKANSRGAIRLRGTHVTIAENHFHDFSFVSGLSEDATVAVFPEATDIKIRGNSFDRIDVGLPVVLVEGGAKRVSIQGNRFSDISKTKTDGITIRSYAKDVVVADNRFDCNGARGIQVTGDRSVVDGNVLTGMSKNAIWIAGEDVMLTNNVVGPLAAAGSGAASQSVIRFRGDGGAVTGNSVACLAQVQTGILLDKHPVLVSDNIVKNCHPTKWLRFLAGQGSTVLGSYPLAANGSNVQSTGTVTQPTCN